MCSYEVRKPSYSVTDARRLIVVLEGANLEIGKIGNRFELLSSDKHATFIRKIGGDPNDYRPDITHQVCLLLTLS